MGEVAVGTTETWHAAMPGAVAGVLMMTDIAVVPDRTFDDTRSQLMRALRLRYGTMSRAEMRATSPLSAYSDYYGKFKQTYHVLLQCESIAIKGKSIPHRPPLVEAMFLAELDSLLLTAGHDLRAIIEPVTIDVASTNDRYIGLGGKTETCRAGDMIMRDGEGVICSIIQGPDQRTALTPETREAMFVVYAPPGIGMEPVRAHLASVAANVARVAPDAKISLLTTIEAGKPHS